MVAVAFSLAWLAVLGIYIAVSAYHQLACTPSVVNLPDGTIERQTCFRSFTSLRMILGMTAYFAGGVVVIWVLSWVFLGWPSEFVTKWIDHLRGLDRP